MRLSRARAGFGRKEGMRIQKYLAHCGVCSRREAERRIEEGRVYVNGKPASIGMDIDESKDKVSMDGSPVAGIVEERVVLAFNKPTGVLCTNSDPFGGKTVFDMLPSPYNKMKLFCVGRLDKNSKGLLVLTNDGDLYNKVIHPSSGIIKKYRVLLNRDLDPKLIPMLLRGVVCEGKKLRAEKIITGIQPDAPFPQRRAEVWMSQGRKREIRRMFETVGLFVKELARFQIGSYVLRRIPEGSYRRMSQNDVEKLLRNDSVE